MNKERTNPLIPYLTITIIFALFYSLIIIPKHKSIRREMKNNNAIILVHEGRLEIENVYTDTGQYKSPVKASTDLISLGFSYDFMAKENTTYVYSVILDGGFLSDGHTYCVNHKGEAGLFRESLVCKLNR